mgnify:CR=1 FL=1|tara:strand:+ start:150 stop:341 length:192 start_codon:yes stop_codon:yes gene_type:complete
MHAIKKLNADIRSSRRRMQAGQLPNAEKSAQQIGATAKRKQPAEHTSTAQPRYIDSGPVTLRP